MLFQVASYDGNSPFEPWPSLAGCAFYLDCGPGETIFYYDSPPQDKTSPTGASVSPPPVFVLIHGLGDEADSWRHLIPLLSSRGFRVLALDLPGFGRSVTRGKISVRGHAAAVLKLIEAAIPNDPNSQAKNLIYFAGNSLGALAAEEAVLQKPGLTRGLILLDGSIPGGPSNPGPIALAKLLLSRKWYRAYRGNPDGAWASLYPYYANLDEMPVTDKQFLKKRVKTRVESCSQEQAFFATQRSLIWAYVSAPSRFARGIRRYPGKILLIWGGKDRIMPLSSAETFKALRPDITLKTIGGAGHLPQQEKPEECARLMAEFADLTKEG